MNAERRYSDFRVAGRTLTGIAIRYGDISPDFRERFEPGALSPVPDVPLTLQHDAGTVLIEAGRYVLADGLRSLDVRADLPADSAAIKLVRRGALTGFSIEFHARAERREAGVRIVERAELTGLSLVDNPAYPASAAEVRARRGRTLRQRIPAERNLGCQCSGVTCKAARILGEAMEEMIETAMSEAVEILAVRGSYGTPLASKGAGSVRMRMAGKDAEVEVDLPDGPDGDAVLRDLDNVPGAVLVRPYLDAAASTSTIEPLTTTDRIKALSGLARRESTDNVAVYSKAVLRSFVIGATDAIEGWPAPELVPTPGMDSERAAPERRRRIWL